MAREEITLKQARRRFATAIGDLETNILDENPAFTKRQLREALEELAFTVDTQGRLHVDDAIHPAFDDMYDPETGEWVGADEDDEDDEDGE